MVQFTIIGLPGKFFDFFLKPVVGSQRPKNKHCRLYQRRLFARLLASDTHVYRNVAITTGDSEGGDICSGRRELPGPKIPGGSGIPPRAPHPQTLSHGGNLTDAKEERVSPAPGTRRWLRVRAANVASLTRPFQPRASEFTGWFVAVKMQLFDTMLTDVLQAWH